jgi:hypothetical protein
MTDPKLPELPPHKGWMNLHGEQSVQQVWGYTAAQMHAYARAAVEQAGGGRDGETITLKLPPPNCRERLRVEGQPYPRSSCQVCGKWSPSSATCGKILDAAMTGGEHG